MLDVATWVPPPLRELLDYCRRYSFYICFIIMLLRAPQLDAAAPEVPLPAPPPPKLRDKFWTEFCKLIACYYY